MELNMRYAVASDGVCIAFATAGRGLPVIRAPFAPFSHCQLEWRQSAFFEQLSRSRMIVPFDPRGTGLSDRNVEDFSLEARQRDIDAVVAALGLERFALHGIGSSGSLVISYAVRYPERVSHLILDDAFSNGRAYQNRPQNLARFQLSGDWEALTENIAFTSQGKGGEDALRYAEYLRACTTPRDMSRAWAAQAEDDVTDILHLVQAPTLIMQHRELRGLNPDEGREMAKRIPNARLLMLDGKQGDVDGVLSAIGEFLGDEVSATTTARVVTPFRSVLFTDIEGHTDMFQRLGDERARAVLREHERITRDVLRAHGGTEVKSMGDGFMASFDSASAAVECAIGLQEAFAAWSEGADEPLRVRVGVNAGEPIAEDDDLFGIAVTTAARIMGYAEGGEILVSSVVRGLVAGKGFSFADRGSVTLKGLQEPVGVFEVKWRD